MAEPDTSGCGRRDFRGMTTAKLQRHRLMWGASWPEKGERAQLHVQIAKSLLPGSLRRHGIPVGTVSYFQRLILPPQQLVSTACLHAVDRPSLQKASEALRDSEDFASSRATSSLGMSPVGCVQSGMGANCATHVPQPCAQSAGQRSPRTPKACDRQTVFLAGRRRKMAYRSSPCGNMMWKQ